MLTKSYLQSFLQCPRRLWLEKNPLEEIPANDSTSRRRIFDGNAVGAKARERLGIGFLWPQSKSSHEEAAEEAKNLLAATPDKAAAEVPMAHSGLFARADALIPKQQKYILQETKASGFPLKEDGTPKEAEEHHINDVAIQAWVMEKSGLPVAHVEINYLNKQWRYPGNGDYSDLFRQMNVTATVEERKALVPQWLKQAQGVLNGPMPDAVTGKHCSTPYDCPYVSFCQQHEPAGPEHPIELLPDLAGKNLARKLRETKGYESLLDPAPEEFTGKQAPLFQRMQAAHRSGQAILSPGSDDIMQAYPYPRYYFDFEGIDLAIPLWPGTKVYDQIPFQWSCHIETAPGVFTHAEFLQLNGDDPSLPCIAQMRSSINPADNGPIFVYSAAYESRLLKELAVRHPEHATLLEGYIGRLVDLLPIVKNHFYHPQMRGSFSIKKVLPAIAPDLNYDELDEVKEGTGAQVAYLEAALDPETTHERKADLDKKLRIYCRQDTWAMVEVAYFLEKKTRPTRKDF
jgi:CRISPR/Cas system-associated exonuclease Cas4 (RecB family)